MLDRLHGRKQGGIEDRIASQLLVRVGFIDQIEDLI